MRQRCWQLAGGHLEGTERTDMERWGRSNAGHAEGGAVQLAKVVGSRALGPLHTPCSGKSFDCGRRINLKGL